VLRNKVQGYILSMRVSLMAGGRCERHGERFKKERAKK